MSYRSQPARVVVAASPNHVHGLNLDDGSLVWTVKLKGTGGLPAVLVIEAVICAAGNGPEVCRIDKASGHVQWRAVSESFGPAELMVDGSRLVMFRKGWLEAWDLATGERHAASRITTSIGETLNLVGAVAPTGRAL